MCRRASEIAVVSATPLWNGSVIGTEGTGAFALSIGGERIIPSRRLEAQSVTLTFINRKKYVSLPTRRFRKNSC